MPFFRILFFPKLKEIQKIAISLNKGLKKTLIILL